MVIEGDLEIVGKIGGGGEINKKRTHIVYTRLFIYYLRVINLKIVGLCLVGEDWGLLQQHTINSGCIALTNRIVVMQLYVDGGRNGRTKLMLRCLKTTVELVGSTWCYLLDIVNKQRDG